MARETLDASDCFGGASEMLIVPCADATLSIWTDPDLLYVALGQGDASEWLDSCLLAKAA
jgi:hypothetical protein